ncbi:rhodanese-like domain-containing protein [Anaerotignum sp. MB30-C6]|uniref:rhodanese-like domain-containing protein n=1 Tax=Anaerotignum sp. MB30-C6 TaxID=3070814 RepID=UPI0027DC4FEB|nr:rhodanese-like domain-containing protein [Anaerotignum sp. MB30-C6]WMI79824.1 rhodanese-like domain-containing protein [Anaerotignum sp. MB30-C6]
MLGLFKRNSGKSIHVNDIDELIGNIELLDIREPFEFTSGSIKTAKNIPMGNLLSSPDQYLLKDKTYYLLCHTGARSSTACRILGNQGFDVINVAGGVWAYSGTQRN